jgi:ABC-type sugar transport system ATPase subunit
VLLLDEPTSALGTAHAALVEELVRYQLISNCSAIIISHDEDQIRRLADARLQLGPPKSSLSSSVRKR